MGALPGQVRVERVQRVAVLMSTTPDEQESQARITAAAFGKTCVFDVPAALHLGLNTEGGTTRAEFDRIEVKELLSVPAVAPTRR